MTGEGLKKVAFVADPKELTHWMLTRLIKRARGLDRDDFYFIDRDDPNLNLHIKQNGIKAIIPLGEGSLRRLVGEKDMIRWRGRVVPHQMGIWTIPTFAPSKLLPQRHDTGKDDIMRNPPRFHGVWMRDVLRALDVAVNGFVRHPRKYLCDPDPEEFQRWTQAAIAAYLVDPVGFRLSWDIETVYKQKHNDESEEKTAEQEGDLLRISFTHKRYTAVSLPWVGGYLESVRQLLALPCVQVVWNGVSFDVPKMRQEGFAVNGEIWDGMDAYHLYEPDLPKGLEWVTSECSDCLPWKHLNMSDPPLYSCIDADEALGNMIELEAALKRRGQWQAFLDHSVNLMPILVRAGAKGNRVDVQAQAVLREKLTLARTELYLEAQQLVPRELKPRKLYKTQPDEVVGDFPPSLTRWTDLQSPDGTWDIHCEDDSAKFCSHCHRPVSNKSEHFRGAEGPLNKKGKPTRLKNPCKEAGATIELRPAFVARFYEVQDFNPNSSDQLKNYIKWAGHPMGKDKKDSSKENADAKHIEFLVGKYGHRHPIYALVLEVHKLSKVIGTYLPEPDANGYIHTEFVNSPSTWRLGSRKVPHGTQIQNWGKRESNPWAKEAKYTIIASPGCKLVQIDSSSVEAVMLGWFMGDVNYIELAAQSVHTWLACKFLGWDFNPDTAAKVKKEHGALYEQMKMGNHMTNYGGSAYVLWQSHPKLFKDKQAAADVQENIFRLIPKLRAYHHNVRYRAQKEGYLETPWHIRHPFYDVFTTNEEGVVKDGKDSKRVVAFEPQSSNGTFQRDNLRLVDKTPFGIYLPAIANVHDSLGLDCPIQLVDAAVETLADIFTRAIPQMGGLRIGAAVEVGDNWGAYHPTKNPGGMQEVLKKAVFDPGTLVRAA